MFVIADDLGLDASSQYDISAEHPITPALDQLADQGLVFENAYRPKLYIKRKPNSLRSLLRICST
jgi:arylsulfatase A-like enzyme